MLKGIICIQFFIFFLLESVSCQTNTPLLPSRMEVRADSVSVKIDSLIISETFLHLVFESKYKGDTTIYYRHYYIDTVNRLLIKCIIDTTFDDYYKYRYTQAVIYFNQGSSLKDVIMKKRE